MRHSRSLAGAGRGTRELALSGGGPEIGQHDDPHQWTQQTNERLGPGLTHPRVDDREDRADRSLRDDPRRGGPRRASATAEITARLEERYPRHPAPARQFRRSIPFVLGNAKMDDKLNAAKTAADAGDYDIAISW